MMDASFVEKFAEKLSRAQVVKVNGIEYLVTPNTNGSYGLESGMPKAESMPAPLHLSTLESLCEYVKTRDRDARGFLLATDAHLDVVVHIESPRQVRVLGPLVGDLAQRAVYAIATAPDISGAFPFGKFLDQQAFMIHAQIGLVDTPDRRSLLTIAGKMREGHVRNFDDDGVSQTVTSTDETRLVGEVALPNPIPLAPYRTFAEVDQPESPFVLRAQGGDDDELPELALFEADGGKWKLDAVASIKTYLSAHLPEGITVLA